MPKVVDHEEQRARFIQTSLTLVASEGLAGLTMRRVAAGSGCTTGAVTHYFASRQQLVVATLRAAHYTAGGRMEAVAARPGAPKRRLLGIVLEALPLDEVRLQEWRVWMAFWAAAVSSRSLQQENRRRYQEWRAALELHCRPIWTDKRQLARRVEQLLAIIDGLGLQLTLQSHRGQAELLRARRSALRVVRTFIDS